MRQKGDGSQKGDQLRGACVTAWLIVDDVSEQQPDRLRRQWAAASVDQEVASPQAFVISVALVATVTNCLPLVVAWLYNRCWICPVRLTQRCV